MGGADEDVALAEAVLGAPSRVGDQPAGRGKEVGGDERELAVAAADHHHRRLQAGLDAGADTVGAGPAAERVAGGRGDVGAPNAGLQRRVGLGRGAGGRGEAAKERRDGDREILAGGSRTGPPWSAGCARSRVSLTARYRGGNGTLAPLWTL